MKTARSFAAVIALLCAACSPQKADWGFQAIDSMKTPADPAMVCGAVIPPTPAMTCAYGPGALASQTLGVAQSVLDSVPIRHVVIVMKENRSFDHLLGKLHDLEPDVEAVPSTFSNPDLQGNQVFPTHAITTCLQNDPGHQSASVAECLDNGKMDGFVRNDATTTGTDGHDAITFYDQTDLPFDYWLASTFAINDRHFAPLVGGTEGNRGFLLFGTNAGILDTSIDYPAPTTPSIFQLLMNAGFTWGVYADVDPLDNAFGWSMSDPGVHTTADFYNALDNGTLPNVSFVDGSENINDDHPDGDLQVGEKWTKAIYDHALASPQWERLAIIWTYDEPGGFADHVPPPPACAPEAGSIATQNGPRVPLAVISQWAKRGYVSHVAHDHTAITRFIEAIFNLPALTARDANSDALFDMFDFSCGGSVATTIPTAPAPGTGGCVGIVPSGAN